MKDLSQRQKNILSVALFAVFSLSVFGYSLQNDLVNAYQSRESRIIRDRQGQEILILPNQSGYWSRYLDEIPKDFKELLIKKEDKYFYYHFGFNPFSISGAFWGHLGIGNRKASSSISQQLVKILLEKESERNLKNKVVEAFYTLSLEIFQSKEEILKMYSNSIYFGNQAQGLAEASKLYFGLSPDLLAQGQMLQLVSSIQSPTSDNPAEVNNKEIAIGLAERLGLDEKNLVITDYSSVKENMKNYTRLGQDYFELKSFIETSKENQTTIDKELAEKARDILKRNVEMLRSKNVNQGAVIIIKLPENEILSLIGSADPFSFESSSQINMLERPRPIGSTIKPFIYLKAFEKGLRPYTLVDDREYKYITAIGLPLYPKNFDYQYRGEVTLHYALSNSLNVPAVKTLEYVGLPEFYNFLEKDLEFNPVQDLDNYQLGIALGSLEMSLADLARYFTIFPNKGVLKQAKLFPGTSSSEKKISEEKYVQLVNKIINDRKTGIEQFGMKSWLNLFQDNYALKTGTSRDFQDSWIIGFTPDFLVGVWLGNADVSPMDEVSGQIGAGRIWAQIMDLLLNSNYNKKNPFDFSLIKEFQKEDNVEYGLAGDDYGKARILLEQEDSSIILNPHNNDMIALEENTRIILKAKGKVNWFVNNDFMAEAQETLFAPSKTGQYKIQAEAPDGSWETIYVSVDE